MRFYDAIVILELEEVLVHQTTAHERKWMKWAHARDIDPVAILPLEGNRPAAARLATLGVDADEVIAQVEMFGIYEHGPCADGAPQFLEQLRGHPWAVVTSQSTNGAAGQLASVALPDPSAMRSSLEEGGIAPALEKAIEDLGAERERCVFFVASRAAAKASLDLGVKAVAVLALHYSLPACQGWVLSLGQADARYYGDSFSVTLNT